MECKQALFAGFVVNAMAIAVIKVRCAELPRREFLRLDLHLLQVTSKTGKIHHLAQKITTILENYRVKLTATI